METNKQRKFKISMEADKTYTLECYFYRTESHQNELGWSVRNLSYSGLKEQLQFRGIDIYDGRDTNYVVVKSSDGPVILVGSCEVLSSKGSADILPKWKISNLNALK